MPRERRALVCLPANTLYKGLRKKYSGEVDVVRAKEQHRLYRLALESLGYSLTTMPADDHYPDSVFVEDPGIIIENSLIITRLRLDERRGEEKRLEQALSPFFPEPMRIEPPGFVEGGDVLVTDGRLYIGLSGRTDNNGAEQLAKIAKDHFGYETDVLEIPKSYLHLKGEVTFHRNAHKGGRKVITVSEEIARHFTNSGCKLIVTPREERFGGNCISAGDQTLVHAGLAKTKKILEGLGFRVDEIDLSEFAKIDGAMTCLSKLWG